MQHQRSQLESKRAEMQSSLEQAAAVHLVYIQVASALKAKVDNSRHGWEQASNELKQQLRGSCNEVTGVSSHRAQLDKSIGELKSLEGKVLNCDWVTTNMSEEIRQIGLNFGDAKKRVHGMESMAEKHKASISQLINQVHNLEPPAVLSTSTGEAEEAKVPATEVRHVGANLESTNMGRMNHWETIPKPELAKVEVLELQVQLLMTQLEESGHEVHVLREEIRNRPHGGPPEGMWPDSHVIGELERKFESLETKYQLLKHAGTPQVNPIGIPTPKPAPRVLGF